MLPCVASQKKKVQDRVHCLCLALLYVQYVAICLWGTVLQPIPSFLLYFIFYFDTHLCVCVGLHEKSGEEEKFLNIFN